MFWLSTHTSVTASLWAFPTPRDVYTYLSHSLPVGLPHPPGCLHIPQSQPPYGPSPLPGMSTHTSVTASLWAFPTPRDVYTYLSHSLPIGLPHSLGCLHIPQSQPPCGPSPPPEMSTHTSVTASLWAFPTPRDVYTYLSHSLPMGLPHSPGSLHIPQPQPPCGPSPLPIPQPQPPYRPSSLPELFTHTSVTASRWAFPTPRAVFTYRSLNSFILSCLSLSSSS